MRTKKMFHLRNYLVWTVTEIIRYYSVVEVDPGISIMPYPFRQWPGWRYIEVYGGVSGGQEDSSINSRRGSWGLG